MHDSGDRWATAWMSTAYFGQVCVGYTFQCNMQGSQLQLTGVHLLPCTKELRLPAQMSVLWLVQDETTALQFEASCPTLQLEDDRLKGPSWWGGHER